MYINVVGALSTQYIESDRKSTCMMKTLTNVCTMRFWNNLHWVRSKTSY
jgi:hypothetical protein